MECETREIIEFAFKKLEERIEKLPYMDVKLPLCSDKQRVIFLDDVLELLKGDK